MPKDTYRLRSKAMFKDMAFNQLELTGDSDTLPGAISFLCDGVVIARANQLFSGELPTLFETNIVRNELDRDEKRVIIGNDQVTIYVAMSDQRDGTTNVVGEFMEHEADANRRRVYIQKLLTKVLHEVSEPLRSALDTLKKSPVADLAPMAYDYLKA